MVFDPRTPFSTAVCEGRDAVLRGRSVAAGIRWAAMEKEWGNVSGGVGGKQGLHEKKIGT